MSRDPLFVLLTVRQAAVDQARQVLAARLKAEQQAEQAITTLDAMVRQQTGAAARFADRAQGVASRDMDLLAAWLGQARGRRVHASATLAALQAQTAQATSALAEARSAARAIEQVIEERRAAARRRQDARDAHALDDIARTRHQQILQGCH
jgi:flagellar export protein FliJ